ncbi:MAG: carboxylesterase family protein [Chloroflexi bacterium]|nr:carboxylesterase family protein [Chloroflexota bacterium]
MPIQTTLSSFGWLGWFTHPALETGDELDDSGNYGTMDLIKALEWIQDNIEAFGGGPNRVIITGESSGAVNVLSLLLSPPAKGLFHRALVQSGMVVSTPISDGEASSEKVLLRLLVNDGTTANQTEAATYIESMSDAEIGGYLRRKSPTDILACYEQKGFGMVIITEVLEDGNVIVAGGADAFDSGAYPNKVPIMVGSTKEEQKMFLYRDPFFEGKEELNQTVANYCSALWKANGVDGFARKVSEHPDQPDVYAYQFNWGAYIEDGNSPIPEPYDLKIGSAHSLDIPFFLGNHSFNVFMTNWVFTEENRPGREALSDAMMAYVAQFARTGNPNAPESDLPEWKPWNNGIQEPKCILFDAGLDTARIKMSDQELTITNVLGSMKAEVPEPLYSEVFDLLSSYGTTSSLSEGNE